MADLNKTYLDIELSGGARGLTGEKGEKGDVGPSNTLTIGEVTAGDEPNASITGESPNQVLNLTLPKGLAYDDTEVKKSIEEVKTSVEDTNTKLESSNSELDGYKESNDARLTKDENDILNNSNNITSVNVKVGSGDLSNGSTTLIEAINTNTENISANKDSITSVNDIVGDGEITLTRNDKSYTYHDKTILSFINRYIEGANKGYPTISQANFDENNHKYTGYNIRYCKFHPTLFSNSDTTNTFYMNTNSVNLKFGFYLSTTINPKTYVLTTTLYMYDPNNNTPTSTSSSVDLPLESMVTSASYDNTNKAIVLTLQSGETTNVPVGDLVSGLVSQTQYDSEVGTFSDINSQYSDSLSLSRASNPTISYYLNNIINLIGYGTNILQKSIGGSDDIESGISTKVVNSISEYLNALPASAKLTYSPVAVQTGEAIDNGDGITTAVTETKYRLNLELLESGDSSTLYETHCDLPLGDFFTSAEISNNNGIKLTALNGNTTTVTFSDFVTTIDLNTAIENTSVNSLEKVDSTATGTENLLLWNNEVNEKLRSLETKINSLTNLDEVSF